jgi:transposase
MTLETFRDELEGIVVESTYNWYGLVDGLRDYGYNVHLAIHRQSRRGFKTYR